MSKNKNDYETPSVDYGNGPSQRSGLAFPGVLLVAYVAAVWSVAGIINYALVYNLAGGGNVAAYYNVTTKSCAGK